MSIKRYECFTGFESTNYEATVTDDGQWVSYDDHAEEVDALQAELRIYKLLVAGGTKR